VTALIPFPFGPLFHFSPVVVTVVCFFFLLEFVFLAAGRRRDDRIWSIFTRSGGFQVFPPPSTPPEPAPPDPRGPSSTATSTSTSTTNPPPQSQQLQQPQVPPRWQLLHAAAASSSLPTASSHTSLDEAACMKIDTAYFISNSWFHFIG
jgi:hypothetical protein